MDDCDVCTDALGPIFAPSCQFNGGMLIYSLHLLCLKPSSRVNLLHANQPFAPTPTPTTIPKMDQRHDLGVMPTVVSGHAPATDRLQFHPSSHNAEILFKANTTGLSLNKVKSQPKCSRSSLVSRLHFVFNSNLRGYLGSEME
ncbi:unnamed protein product [Trichobilharzia regenti]|nr:unnamed protein product [Trichobilharzia regenti]